VRLLEDHRHLTGVRCVEVADGVTGVVPVRDSKNPGGPVLAFTPSAWTSFVRAAARGELPTAP